MVSGAQFRRVVWPLAIAETLVWAGFYYIFPALLRVWERAISWGFAGARVSQRDLKQCCPLMNVHFHPAPRSLSTFACCLK